MDRSLPFYLEALVGAFNGDNEPAFGRGRIREPLITGRLRTFFELGDAHGLQLGVSVAHGLDASGWATLPESMSATSFVRTGGRIRC